MAEVKARSGRGDGRDSAAGERGSRGGNRLLLRLWDASCWARAAVDCDRTETADRDRRPAVAGDTPERAATSSRLVELGVAILFMGDIFYG